MWSGGERVLMSPLILCSIIEMAPVQQHEFKLRKFDPSKMDTSRAVVVIGGSGTGKSHIVKALLYHNRSIPSGLVFSGTEDGDAFFSKFVPDLWIYNDWLPEKVETLIANQRRSKKKIDDADEQIQYHVARGQTNAAAQLRAERERRLNSMRKYIVIDDLGFKKNLTKSDTLRKLFMNGRHWGLYTMLTLQYCMDLDISLRGNAGYIFMCREMIVNYRRRLYESFCGMLPSFSVFEKVFDACTQNYEVLVIDRTSRSSRVEDCLFWWKAEPTYAFKLGSDKIWQLHHKRYDTKHDDAVAGAKIQKRG